MNRTRGIGLCISFLVVVSACSAVPEDKTSGRCTLSCNNTRVSGAEFAVEPMTATPLALHCEANFGSAISAPTPAPIQVRFRLVELIPPFGTSIGAAPAAGGAAPAAGGAAPAAGGGSTTDTPLLTKRPVSGVGFEPELHGLVSIENSAAEFKPTPTTVSSAKFAGIVTPAAEWCSDTCGVITYEFWPKCINTNSNSISAGVAVHGVGVSPPIQLNLTNP